MTDLNTADNEAALAASTGEDDAALEAAAMWAEFDEADGETQAAINDNGDVVERDEPELTGDFADTVDGSAAEVVAEAEPVAEAAAPVATPAAAPASSLWDNVTPEQRAELDRLAADKARLEHEVRSHKGRAVGAQRRYDELVKAAQPRNAGPGDRPTPKAALSALTEDYPEFAGPLEKAFEAIQGEVATLHTAEEGRRQAAETELNEYVNEQTQALNALHPGYVDLFKANGPKLMAWIDDQPRATRDAFMRNADHIVDAAEAAQVISAFKAFLAPPAETPAVPTPGATTLSDRRQRQLGSTAAPSRANRRPTVSGIPEDGDPQQIWDAFDQAEAKR